MICPVWRLRAYSSQFLELAAKQFKCNCITCNLDSKESDLIVKPIDMGCLSSTPIIHPKQQEGLVRSNRMKQDFHFLTGGILKSVSRYIIWAMSRFGKLTHHNFVLISSLGFLNLVPEGILAHSVGETCSNTPGFYFLFSVPLYNMLPH